jgi:glycerol-3-phosphate O-acyltransferase
MAVAGPSDKQKADALKKLLDQAIELDAIATEKREMAEGMRRDAGHAESMAREAWNQYHAKLKTLTGEQFRESALGRAIGKGNRGEPVL